MKLAFARAGLWFFGTIIFILVFLSEGFKDEPVLETLGYLLFFGFLAAGTAFFYTLYVQGEEERELQKREREIALQAQKARLRDEDRS